MDNHFNPHSIRPNGAKAVCDDLRRCPSYSLETFDVKVTSIASVGGEEGTRLDARLLLRRGDDGRIDLKVLMVKKNEIKDVTLDILNLHRLKCYSKKICILFRIISLIIQAA